MTARLLVAALLALLGSCTILNRVDVADPPTDAGVDAGVDGGPDAGVDAGPDTGRTDAGPPWLAECVPSGDQTYEVVQLALRTGGGCVVVERDGASSLRCWGLNDGAQLGNGGVGGETALVEVGGALSLDHVGVGPNHSCAHSAADGRVYCWGRSTTEGIGAPCDGPDAGLGQVCPLPTAVHEDLGPVELAVSASFTLERRSDGRVFVWGTGAIGGRLVEATGTSEFDSEQIVAAGNRACLRDDGRVFCWGSNRCGASGQRSMDGMAITSCDTATTPVSEPTRVGLPAECYAVDVAVSSRTACAVCADGRLFCWGRNLAGMLGRGNDGTDLEASSTPALARIGLVRVVRVSMEEDAEQGNTCALLDDGSIRCVGSNGHGQLRRASLGPDDRTVDWTDVMETDAVRVEVGDGFVCAVRSDCETVCWGRGEDGRLGDGGDTDSASPVALSFE